MANTSDEDNTKLCDPCKYSGLQKIATSYCQDCDENLCDSCEDTHGKLKATRGHQIKQFDDSNKMTSQQKALVSTIMTCTVHPSDILTHYCDEHKHSVCRLCLLTTHRNCKTNTLKNVAGQTQIRDKEKHFLQKTKTVLHEFKELQDSRRKDEKQVGQNAQKCREDLKRFKQEIISRVEKMEKELLKEIDKVENGLLVKINVHVATSDAMLKQLDDLKKSLESIANVPEAVFVQMEKNENRLKEAKDIITSINKEIQSPVINFRKSEKLENLMSEIQTLGILKTEPLSASNTIEDKNSITMDTPAFNFLDIKSVTKGEIIDAGTTCVTGCAFLPNGDLVICVGGNNAVKHFTRDFKLKSTLNTGYDVWDITAVSTETVVMTDPINKQIQFLNILDTITKGKTIHVGMACYGIDYENDRLHVSCMPNDGYYYCEDNGKGTINVLTMNGDTVNTFTITQGQPLYISINKAGDKLIVCDNSSSVQCIDTNGTTLYTYSDTELESNHGVLFDSYDNFMACGWGSRNLHVVKKGGSKHKILLTSNDGLVYPLCLAYRESDRTLVVGQHSERNSLLAFKLGEINLLLS